MKTHRFPLEPYKGMSTRYRCPKCLKKNKFSRYIDIQTGLQLGGKVGICERKKKCGYHYPPRAFFKNNGIVDQKMFANVAVEKNPRPKSVLPFSIVEKSLESERINNFEIFLLKIFDTETVNGLIEKYKIGTSKYWNGATIFWQIDENYTVRTGKMMLYNKTNGKKQKINWMHSILKCKDYNLSQCLFGLHLINQDKHKPIGIVESEKTAIICSVLLPEFTWLATGGLTNLKSRTLKPLSNRTVVLFPDANCFDDWAKKRNVLPKNIRFRVSELLDYKANKNEKYEDYDIADYLLALLIKNKSISNCRL